VQVPLPEHPETVPSVWFVRHMTQFVICPGLQIGSADWAKQKEIKEVAIRNIKIAKPLLKQKRFGPIGKQIGV
jgi:hypothetical protein